MQSYPARYASFNPSRRSKSSSKGIPRWPHPDSYLATPTSLATAGFYFNPSSSTPDAVTCFICDKGLADWDPHDDPAQIHAAKCPKCPWAILNCVKDKDGDGNVSFASPSRLPASRAMEKARLATFGPTAKRWWPHDVKNKGPTSKSMAKTGFIYTPMGPKDDTCTCIYCDIQLGGWQTDDDPMEEHRSRQAKNGPCPFFTHTSDASSAPANKQRTRTKSKPPTTSAPSPSDDDEYQPPGTKSSTYDPAPSMSSRKASGSAKSAKSKSVKTATRSKTIKDEVVTEYHIVLDENEDAPPKPRPKTRRTSSRTSSRSRSRASSTRNTTADGGESVVSSMRPTQSKRLAESEDLPADAEPKPEMDVHSKPVPSPHPVIPPNGHPQPQFPCPQFKSFQSPEDEEFAREEEALEEQARELMLADPTLTLVTTPLQEWAAEQYQDAMPNTLWESLKGKDKAKMLLAEAAVDVDTPAPSTPPPQRGTAAMKPILSSAVKFPQIVPDDTLIALADVERAMTVEQWVRHEMDRQYERLRSDGRQKIDAFKAHAQEVATQIENL